MRKLYIAIISLAVLLVVGIVYADTRTVTGEDIVSTHKTVADSTDLEVLRSIYQDFVDPKEYSGCTVEFITTSVFKNIEGGLDTTQMSGVYAATSARMELLTDSLSVYGDNAVMVADLPHSKELYLTSLDDIDYKKIKRRMMGLALESMFEDGTVLENTVLPVSRGSSGIQIVGASPDRKIVIKPGSEIINRLGVDRISITFNRDERALRDVLVEYAPDIRVQSTRMRYDTFQWNNVPESFAVPLLQTFFDEHRMLRSPWEGYTVNDRRYQAAAK